MNIKITKKPKELNWIDVLILKAFSEKIPISISNLFYNGFINHNKELTTRGQEVLKHVYVDDEEKTNIKTQNNDLEFEEFLEKYRLKFKGKKLGAMGDKIALKEKMIRFLKNHDYSYEHILNSIQLYINSCASKKYLYLTQAHYTIYKKTAKEEVSILAGYCEELEPGTIVQDFETSSNNNNYDFI